MKKFIFLTIFIFSLTFLSAEESLFSFSAGLTSGGVIYTDPEVKKINNSIGTPTPFNIGTNLYANLNVTEQITFFLGTDLFFSLNTKNQQSFNHLFLNIPFGIKIYPNLKGFCIGAAYVPGFRKDFIKADDYTDLTSSFQNWTNGFKFSIEYNFRHNSEIKFLPTIGLSWTCMPRANYNYDNFITGFILINL